MTGMGGRAVHPLPRATLALLLKNEKAEEGGLGSLRKSLWKRLRGEKLLTGLGRGAKGRMPTEGTA